MDPVGMGTFMSVNPPVSSPVNPRVPSNNAFQSLLPGKVQGVEWSSPQKMFTSPNRRYAR